MQNFGPSLLSTDSLSTEHLQVVLDRARRLKERKGAHVLVPSPGPRPIVLTLFFEPSTRTKTSFHMAGHRLGLAMHDVQIGSFSSVSKGESEVDTFLNVQAMAPDLMVVRFGENPELAAAIDASAVPIVSGGSGARSHPTQALLDAFTIQEALGSVSGQKVLVVGDIVHSRVARSNAQLLTALGAEVAYCGPGDFLPAEAPGVRVFEDLRAGLQWASVIMALRIQFERHPDSVRAPAKTDFIARYGLTPGRLRDFSAEGIILHPGPVNWGVELDSAVATDPRSRILRQVENGVYVRAAVLALLLGLEVKWLEG